MEKLKNEKNENNIITFTASNGCKVKMIFTTDNCDKSVEAVKKSILAVYEKRIRRV